MAQFGAMTVIDNPTPTTSMAGIGGGMSTMNPMESVMAIFEEMRDGINTLVDLSSKTFALQVIANRNMSLNSGDTDTAPEITGGDGDDKPGMLDSLKGMFEGGIGEKLGLVLMLGALATLFAFGDEIAATLEPILKSAKEFYDTHMPALKVAFDKTVEVVGSIVSFVTDTFESVFGEGSSVYLGIAAIAAILFPSTLTFLLGAGVGTIKFALTAVKTAFTAMQLFLSGSLAPKIMSAFGGGLKGIKNLIIAAANGVKNAFIAMRVFMVSSLAPAITSAFGGALAGAKNLWIIAVTKIKTAFLAMKSFMLLQLAPAITSSFGGALAGAKNLWIMAITKVGVAFTAMKFFMVSQLAPAIMSAFGGVAGPAGKAGNAILAGAKAIGAAFTAMRLYMTATLAPTLLAVMGPIAIPLALVVAAVAAAVAIFVSIKAGIDEFKESLASGDTMLESIIDGVATAFLTLTTLPITLIKDFAAWTLEKLGFEGIAAKLKEFNFVDFIKDGITTLVDKIMGFIGGLFEFDLGVFFAKVSNIGAVMLNYIKAIASGAAAALLALAPGGKSPTEAYNEAFAESMTGSEVKMEAKQQAKIKSAELDALDKEKEEAEFVRYGKRGGSTVVDASQTTTSTSNSSFTTTTLSVDHGDETQAVLGRVVKPGGRSDIRLKEDIKLIGKSPSDINIYEFKYIGEEGKYEGVMAQEVPWASSIADNGFLWVDYTKLDVDFVKLS